MGTKTPNKTDQNSGVELLDEVIVKRPDLFKVIMHNDDYSTMEFVIFVLKIVFHKSEVDAHDLMVKVHNEGHAIVGIYTYEIAESKVLKVQKLAKEQGHPLKCTLEVS